MRAERYRAVHIAADRRRPFAHIGERRPDPARLTLNQKCALWLYGLATGVGLIVAVAMVLG